MASVPQAIVGLQVSRFSGFQSVRTRGDALMALLEGWGIAPTVGNPLLTL